MPSILSVLPERPLGATLRRRVLVVEDNIDGAFSVVLLLREMGHQVEFAIDGATALGVAKRLRPDIVLLDLSLPDMSGIEVCRRLRSIPETMHVRIVAITAHSDEESRRRTREAGFDAHFAKPVHPRVLEELLG